MVTKGASRGRPWREVLGVTSQLTVATVDRPVQQKGKRRVDRCAEADALSDG